MEDIAIKVALPLRLPIEIRSHDSSHLVKKRLFNRSAHSAVPTWMLGCFEDWGEDYEDWKDWEDREEKPVYFR